MLYRSASELLTGVHITKNVLFPTAVVFVYVTWIVGVSGMTNDYVSTNLDMGRKGQGGSGRERSKKYLLQL